ncbi:hypothetical protein BXZ70DRAFT_800279 [Cristinia sonorae]|uniref:Uncharacterized protein n=1 Tax=Cristinia sonorae TaxID=1940300 RepID=A0A8K0UTA6_9AGAR|nr:hypothetical protein BXZ70DRAFT_800279 [Cristinia sonorae]
MYTMHFAAVFATCSLFAHRYGVSATPQFSISIPSISIPELTIPPFPTATATASSNDGSFADSSDDNGTDIININGSITTITEAQTVSGEVVPGQQGQTATPTSTISVRTGAPGLVSPPTSTTPEATATATSTSTSDGGADGVSRMMVGSGALVGGMFLVGVAMVMA